MSSDIVLVEREADPQYAGILQLVQEAQTIAISGHTSPDGDALGSTLGLGLSLQARFPGKDIAMLIADDVQVPRVYRFMKGSDQILPASGYAKDPDLFFSVDCPTLERLNNSAAVARRAKHLVCFDHHPAREEFAEISIRRPEAAACVMIVNDFLEGVGIKAMDDIATCMLCGLVTDTGRFQYQNADAAAFHAGSKFVAHGADPARVSLEVYQSQRIEYLHLESIVMGRIKTVANGRVAFSYATQEDLASCGVSQDECDGLVDIVRQVDGVEVCLFLKECDCGKVRGNLRSKGALDVSDIATLFGGGGHKAAAGFTYEGSIRETLGAALPMLAELVGESVCDTCLEPEL